MWVPPLGLAGKPAHPVRRRRSNGRQTTPHHSQPTGPVHRWQVPRGRDLPVASAASAYARPAGDRRVMPVHLPPSPLTPAGEGSPPTGKWEVVPGKASRAAGCRLGGLPGACRELRQDLPGSLRSAAEQGAAVVWSHTTGTRWSWPHRRRGRPASHLSFRSPGDPGQEDGLPGTTGLSPRHLPSNFVHARLPVPERRKLAPGSRNRGDGVEAIAWGEPG